MSCHKTFWLLIAIICTVHGALKIPTYDDGTHFTHIYHTIDFSYPFYNELVGGCYHFMKPLILLQACLFSAGGNLNFRLMALFQSLELFACAWLMFCCVKKYTDEYSSKAGALLFLYFLFAEYFITPTRNEPTLILCIFSVLLLTERFSASPKIKYLLMASAVTFLLAIPMHTNGSIPCIYLFLYTVAQRRSISRSSLLKLCICTALFASTGAAIIIYPGIQSFAQYMAVVSSLGGRFSASREHIRLTSFVGNQCFFPVVLLMLSGLLMILIKKRRLFLPLHTGRLQKYRNVFLLLTSVFIGLGILPSAFWPHYTLFYCIPLIILFSVALHHMHKESGMLTVRLTFLAIGALTLWNSRNMPALHLVLYAGPFFAAGMVPKRISPLTLVYMLIIPMLFYKSIEMVVSKNIYDRAEAKIHTLQKPIIGTPLFNFAEKNFVPVMDEPDLFPLHISTVAGNTFIEAKPVANGNELLKKLPLGTRFTSAKKANPRAKPDARRFMGNEFWVVGTQRWWGMLDFVKAQVQPFGYAAVNELSLSSDVLDRYANYEMRGLKFIQYRFVGK